MPRKGFRQSEETRKRRSDCKQGLIPHQTKEEIKELAEARVEEQRLLTNKILDLIHKGSDLTFDMLADMDKILPFQIVAIKQALEDQKIIKEHVAWLQSLTY